MKILEKYISKNYGSYDKSFPGKKVLKLVIRKILFCSLKVAKLTSRWQKLQKPNCKNVNIKKNIFNQSFQNPHGYQMFWKPFIPLFWNCTRYRCKHRFKRTSFKISVSLFFFERVPISYQDIKVSKKRPSIRTSRLLRFPISFFWCVVQDEEQNNNKERSFLSWNWFCSRLLQEHCKAMIEKLFAVGMTKWTEQNMLVCSFFVLIFGTKKRTCHQNIFFLFLCLFFFPGR